MAEIDFSDSLFVLDCGCILDGCSGAAGVNRFIEGVTTTAYCPHHKQWALVDDMISTKET